MCTGCRRVQTGDMSRCKEKGLGQCTDAHLKPDMGLTAAACSRRANAAAMAAAVRSRYEQIV